MTDFTPPWQYPAAARQKPNESGTGDFDGDGKADILWHSLAKQFRRRRPLDYERHSRDQRHLGNVWPGWEIAGVADFDGNGKSDILWRDTSGNVAVWIMDGSTISDYAGLGNVSDRLSQ